MTKIVFKSHLVAFTFKRILDKCTRLEVKDALDKLIVVISPSVPVIQSITLRQRLIQLLDAARG